MILRAADDLIYSGGRNLLAKILKGSKDKKIMELNLNHSIAYGSFANEPISLILNKIDWMILNDYLQIEYNGSLPMIIYTDKGWEIEAETYSEELYQKIITELNNQEITFIPHSSKINRKVIYRILDKIEASEHSMFYPFLELWKQNEVRKVRQRITEVQASLSSDQS